MHTTRKCLYAAKKSTLHFWIRHASVWFHG